MRKLLLLLFCLPVMAQTAYKTEKGEIIWEKIYDTAEHIDVTALLNSHPELKQRETLENMYTGEAFELKNTCQGGTGLMQNPISFDYVIYTEPHRYGYVVRVKNIRIVERFGPMQARTVATPVEKYFVDKGVVKATGVATQNMDCMDSFFTQMFAPGGTPAEAPTALTSNK